jgi:glycosyltransferase involved in cell wall biosynthesis
VSQTRSLSPPRVTVILATYNWSSVLRYSTSSVLRQTYADFELLVVGDGCTDNSENVVRGFGDGRVRWINLLENTKHQSGPNNEGLRQARGEIIAYIGHDDLWLPHHLDVMVRAYDEAGTDLAYSLCSNVPPNSPFGWPAIPRPHAGSFASPVCMTHRKRVTEQIGGWRNYRELPSSTSPDVELWQRAAAAGLRLTFVPRLTGIKFPASWRRDVYRTRPCHEQAAWSEAMQKDPEFEVHQLVHFIAGDTPVPVGLRYRDLVRHLVRQTLARVSVRRVLRWFGASIDQARRFKGL